MTGKRYDMTKRYDVLVVHDVETGPEHTEENLDAEQVLEFFKGHHESQLYIVDRDTGKLSGLKYEL